MAVDLPRRLPALIATAAAHGWRTEILTSHAAATYRVLVVTWSRDGLLIEVSWTRASGEGWHLASADMEDAGNTVRLRVRDVPGVLATDGRTTGAGVPGQLSLLDGGEAS